MKPEINDEYLRHPIFGQLSKYAEFYESLSVSVMMWTTQGTASIINMDTYVFSSIQGTLESIRDILIKGRINDSYALLRKYYDSTIINVYSNLYLQDNFSIENFIVLKIDNWLKGKEKIPSFEHMSKYIISSKKLEEITKLLFNSQSFKGSAFEKIRQRCNDHTHYLYYKSLLLNDNTIRLDRNAALNNLAEDVKAIFILHLSYMFYLNDNYMMSSDYTDYLEAGQVPPEDFQYLVAPFVQEVFDGTLKPKRPDIVIAIKNKTSMKLN